MDDSPRYRRLLERYRNADLDRRVFVSLIGAAALGVGLGGGALSGLARYARAARPEYLRFDGWGGIVSEALRRYAFDPFTTATGIEVVDGTFSGSDDYLTQVRAGDPGEFQMFHVGSLFDYTRYHALGYSVRLNEGNIPNLVKVIKKLQDRYRAISDGTLSAVPYDYGSTGIAFNLAYISEQEIQEKGVQILNDKRYAGRIGGSDNWRTRIWYAALQTGQDPNAIADIDAIWEKLRMHRRGLHKYWRSGAELTELLATEKIVVTEAWSGRVAALQEDGHYIGYYQPPGVLSWLEGLMVLKGSPQEACEALLDFMLEPEVAITVAEAQSYAPSLDPTQVEMGEKIPTLPGFDPTGTLDGYAFADPAYWNRHQTDWSRSFGWIRDGA